MSFNAINEIEKKRETKSRYNCFILDSRTLVGPNGTCEIHSSIFISMKPFFFIVYIVLWSTTKILEFVKKDSCGIWSNDRNILGFDWIEFDILLKYGLPIMVKTSFALSRTLFSAFPFLNFYFSRNIENNKITTENRFRVEAIYGELFAHMFAQYSQMKISIVFTIDLKSLKESIVLISRAGIVTRWI